MPVIMRLNKTNNKIQLKTVERKIKLQHLEKDVIIKKVGPRGLVGPIGPVSTVPGPPGPTGESNFIRIIHGSDPNVARPTAFFVEWVGSVAPVNGTTEDTWIDES